MTTKNYRGFDYYAYKGLGKDVAGHMFSVVSIDDPYGYAGGGGCKVRYQNEAEFNAANVFGKGQDNVNFAQYFTGASFLNPLTESM